MAKDVHLTSRDVATELGCSVRHATGVMREMSPINIAREGSARPLWRVARTEFEDWKERRTEALKAPRNMRPRIRARSKFLDSSEKPRTPFARSHGPLPDLNEGPPIRLPQPRTKRKD
jgi:hypothetical protein